MKKSWYNIDLHLGRSHEWETHLFLIVNSKSSVEIKMVIWVGNGKGGILTWMFKIYRVIFIVGEGDGGERVEN
jgi:hypothetical protein